MGGESNGMFGVHIRCCGHGHLGFRSYSGSLLANAPKVTKRSLPHHSAPRLGSVCPHSGLNPWAAATGHPWPNTANPASCRVSPRIQACVRPARRPTDSSLPSLSEVPSGGARALWLLWGFSKVTRCKSGTYSRRDRSNGCVHQPTNQPSPTQPSPAQPNPTQPNPTQPHH